MLPQRIDMPEHAFYAGVTQLKQSRPETGSVTDRLTDIVDQLRSNRREIFAELMKHPDSLLDGVCKLSFGTMPARWVVLNFADHDEEHLIQLTDTLQNVPRWHRTKAHILLGAAEATRGALLATLAGLGDDDLDVVPESPSGEWSLRQTLSHIIFVEHAYRIDVLHAVEHFKSGEAFDELPDIDLPYNYPEATFAELIGKLDAARDQTLEELHHVDDADLRAPTIWDGLRVDANFLMMRLAHHEREHTAHIQKWRVQAGRQQTEFQRLLGLGWVTHGRLRSQLAGVSDDTLQQKPFKGEWSAAEILEHLHAADHVIKRNIDMANIEKGTR
jgi:uncharacterized damage-inducible protein DinB